MNWTSDETATTPRHDELLGCFIREFSRMESLMHLAVRSLVGIDEKIARLLIGEPRMQDLLDKLKIFAEEKSKPADYLREVESVSREITYLTGIRSIVAHKPFESDDTRYRFFDARSTKKLEKAFVFECSLDQMQALGFLARQCGHRLSHLRISENGPWPHPSATARRWETFRERQNLPANPKDQSNVAAQLRRGQSRDHRAK